MAEVRLSFQWKKLRLNNNLPRLIGHRGVKDLEPENTLKSISTAFELGLECVEVDVKISKDKIPLLLHDDSLERTTTGFGLVSNFRFEEINQLDAGYFFYKHKTNIKVPKLSDVLEFVKIKQKYINIELKPNKGLEEINVEKILEEVKKISYQKIYFSSFDLPSCISLKEKSPHSLCGLLKDDFDNSIDKKQIAFEYLYHFNKLFNKLKLLQSNYEHINSIKTLHSLYREIIKNEKVPFSGEPLKGMQVMGILESRVFDFETVIISSLNEGILPTGNTSSTFIPFDVRIQHNLPIYKDKDTIYSYHFYRLLQRAKNIHLLYNTEPDVINGGEMSRFIRQLEIENIHKINHKILVPKPQ